MKKIFVVMFITVLVLVGCSSKNLHEGNGYKSGDVIKSGTYIYGKDINVGGYMYNIIGKGRMKIEIDSGEEKMFYDNETGDGRHFMELPFSEGDKLIIKGDLELEFV